MPTAINPGLRRKALRSFKQRGYAVHVKALETVLQAFNDSEQSDNLPAFLEKIFEHLSRPGAIEDGILTLRVAEEISSRVAQSDARDEGNADAAFEVIDVFAAPAWLPTPGTAGGNGAGGKTAPSSTGIAGLPLAKAELFRSRYNLIRSKTLRNPGFTPPASGILARNSSSPYLQLTGIESLAGTQGDKLVLGMLTQLEEGSWYLEDLHGHVKLDLTTAHVTAGFHTECSFVIAQGEHVEEASGESVFRVSAMGTPPLEEREASMSALGKHSNLFGGNFDMSQLERLRKMEAEEPDAMILLLSDVALDNPRVLVGIRHILQGYLEDDVVPKVVVLMGSFLSHPFGQHVDDLSLLTSKFTQLGRLIAEEFPSIAAASAFVLVPSLRDPGPGNVLPRPPLPPMVTAGFTEALGSADRVHLATNPCRMRYLSQEIIVLREDLMQKMVRHCAVEPDMAETSVMSEHLIKSVVDQAHLSPLPLSVRPTIWNYDHALRLFPTPHVLAIADRVECYVCKYGGALGVNPGSFATDFSFTVYLPAERRAQQCSIDSERAPGAAPASPVQVESESEGEDFGSDSDSGHSMHSLLRSGRKGSDDDDDGSEGDIDLDELPTAPAVEQQKAKKAPLQDTQSVLGDSEPVDEMQTEPGGKDQNGSSEPKREGAADADDDDPAMQTEAKKSDEDAAKDDAEMHTGSKTEEHAKNPNSENASAMQIEQNAKETPTEGTTKHDSAALPEGKQTVDSGAQPPGASQNADSGNPKAADSPANDEAMEKAPAVRKEAQPPPQESMNVDDATGEKETIPANGANGANGNPSGDGEDGEESEMQIEPKPA